MPAAYVRVADEIAQAITAGQLPPGAKLPSIRQLCAEHDVGKTTVKTALAILEDRGLIVGQQGRAFYVAEPD